MRCPSCQSDNPDGSTFCAACGSRLATCTQCQAELTPGGRFCSACGHPVGDALETPGRGAEDEAAGIAERRRVSILFVDLVNFTPLAETMDPEEVRAVQARYFEVARSVVTSHGGTIEKFIGDAVMAVWGAPTAHEDDAERAVRAALAIVHAVERLGGAAAGRAMRARAAVTTGEAAVTVGALDQGIVAGDLVNVAARLQGRAPEGGVLVDRGTRDGVPSGVAFRRMGSLALKGRTGRLEAYVATQGDGVPTSVRGAHGGRLVGRDREFRELTDLLSGVMRDGRCRLVSVTGIAGIGKSRLAREVDQWVEAHPDVIAWHEGRALAYGEGVAFAPIAQMVRRRARIGDQTPPELARRQLESTLEELVRDDAERRWLGPRIAALLAREEVASFHRDELFAAWRRFFERVADRTPVVLVFEDLQWADAGLLDFIEHVAAWSRAEPIFLLTLSRPDLLDRRPSWGVGVGSFTALSLDRLPEADMRELLADRAPTLSRNLVKPILERAGGVPLYAVEVARMLTDSTHGGAAEPPRGDSGASLWSGGAVPSSLHGVIAARIDSLPAAERRLLMAAAILGHRFRPEALVAVAGEDSAATRERIDGLVRREMLSVDEELASPGRGELEFVQDLVRDVAFSTLARNDRRALHLAAARYLESLDASADVAEQLAGQLVEAHRLTTQPKDAERLARRAVAALREAAGGAMSLHVPGRALDLLQAALSLTDATQRPSLLADAAEAASAAGLPAIAEAHLRDLIGVYAASGDRPAAAHTRAQLASVLLTAHANEPALVELESAIRAVRRWEADPSGVELAAQLARARSLLGDDREALAWADRALAAAERLELWQVATDVLVTRGTARFSLGEQEAGLADLSAATARARDEGWLHTELRARNNEAWALLDDDPRAAMETARQGFELATAMGLGDRAVPLADIACTAAIETAEWGWAVETIEQLAEREVPEAYRVVFRATIAIIAILGGDPDAGEALARLQALPPDTDEQVVASVRMARAWSALVARQLEDARAQAELAIEGSAGAYPPYHRALATRASLWLRDRASAAASIDRLGSPSGWGRAREATLLTMRAGLAALAEDPDAERLYRAAGEAWETLRLPLQHSLCLLDRHLVLGGDPAQLLEGLDSLGAHGLRGLVSSGPAPRRSARSRRPSGGTGRRTGEGRRRPPATDRPAPPG